MFGPDRLARLLGVLGDLISDLRTATNPRLCFEISLTRMVRPDSDLTLESLAERIEALESGMNATIPAVRASAPAAVPAPAPVVAPVASVPPASMPVARPIAAPAQPAPTSSPAQPAPVSAPKPVSVPAPAAVPPTGDLAGMLANPAALQRVWRSVVTAVKKEKISYGVLFMNVKVHPDQDAQGIVIEFPSDNPFAFNMAQKPDVHQVLTGALAQAAGTAVPFRCVQGAAAPASAASASTAAPAPHPAAPHVAPVSRAVPTAPMAAPEPDDEVPLDAYEGIPEAQDAEGGVPVGAPSASAPVAAPAADSAQPLDEGDLSKMLSDTMGQAIVFEEVDE
jgi:DNA polymerase-3 subunit gamma/tau